MSKSGMKKAEINQGIRLKDFQVTDVSMHSSELFKKEITNKLGIKIIHNIKFSDSQSNEFLVVFLAEIATEDDDFKLIIKYIALFETESEIDEEFKESKFIQQSPPAIAFPYLRSFLITLSSNAGYNPIILPALNFTKITDEDDELDDLDES